LKKKFYYSSLGPRL